ncbi:MAG: transketolase family protein [Christensenellales bacterium]|jgi:transketolase
MSKAIRDVYGELLAEYGKINKDVVVLDADVSSSTKTSIFAKECPDRFYNVGIAEQCMAGMAAGFAITGKIPFVNTFAAFITTLCGLAARSVIGYSDLNVKLMGAYGGMSDAYDGATHHSNDDLSIMRTFPGYTVLVPSDAAITGWMIKTAIEYKGPMYIRLSRDSMPDIYKEDEEFEIGKSKIVHDGTDATLIACGIMVGRGIEAARELAKEGISLRVVDMYSIKPLDSDMILKCADETGAVITAEEHTVLGGLGGAVSETLALGRRGVPMEMLGINDVYTVTGAYDQLLCKYGLDVETVIESVKRVVAAK